MVMVIFIQQPWSEPWFANQPLGLPSLQALLDLEGASAGGRPRLLHPAAGDDAALVQLAAVHKRSARGGGQAVVTEVSVVNR